MATLRDIGESAVGAGWIATCILFRPLLRGWYIRWGATAEEVRRTLPGDEIAPGAKNRATRAVHIQATPGQIWPWLVQIGQERGGLYSYELLENAAGCQMHNTETIVPDFQKLEVGDTVRLGPKGYPLYRVIAFEHHHYLLMIPADPATEKVGEPGDIMAGSWLFYLHPQPDGTTRLIARSRQNYPDGFAHWLLWRAFTEPMHFVMERRMLLGIKALAEATTWQKSAQAAAEPG